MKLNRGYFESLRDSHPVTLGSIINGKRVTQTCYTFRDGKTVPIFYLDGDRQIWTKDGDQIRVLEPRGDE